MGVQTFLILREFLYITKNKATGANIFTDWEAHGSRQIIMGGHVTPGQAFTMEWGFGQALPFAKDMSKLAQIGLVGYDQWQVSNNSGITSVLPYYSVHALGAQGNFMMPKIGLSRLWATMRALCACP